MATRHRAWNIAGQRSLLFREALFEKLVFGKLIFKAGSWKFELLEIQAWKLENEASQKRFLKFQEALLGSLVLKCLSTIELLGNVDQDMLLYLVFSNQIRIENASKVVCFFAMHMPYALACSLLQAACSFKLKNFSSAAHFNKTFSVCCPGLG